MANIIVIAHVIGSHKGMTNWVRLNWKRPKLTHKIHEMVSVMVKIAILVRTCGENLLMMMRVARYVARINVRRASFL